MVAASDATPSKQLVVCNELAKHEGLDQVGLRGGDMGWGDRVDIFLESSNFRMGITPMGVVGIGVVGDDADCVPWADGDLGVQEIDGWADFVDLNTNIIGAEPLQT